jgi:hypothetical protein
MRTAAAVVGGLDENAENWLVVLVVDMSARSAAGAPAVDE